MKKYKLTLALVITLIFGNLTAFAQGNSEESKQKNKEKIEKVKERKLKDHSEQDHDDHNHDKIKKEKKENFNNGNAYGKNKNGLTGREFGELRSEEAKNKIKKQEKNLVENEIFVRDGREKIEKIRDRVKKQKENQEITLEEAIEKEKKISNAEEKLKELEDRISKGREDLKKRREEFRKVVFPE